MILSCIYLMPLGLRDYISLFKSVYD